jgi:hypothetical protein
MSSDFYCGSGKVPKNKRIGSMQECAQAGKVSYWGIKQIDSRILEFAKTNKTVSLTKARSNKIKLDARLKKLKRDYENEKDADKKKEIKKNIEKTDKEYKKATLQYEKAFDASETKKEKKASKKSSKKSSKK